jgi:general secretion pathway protein A
MDFHREAYFSPMYEEYFGLKKKAFSIVPDPSYFFMSEGHKEALAHLLYGIQNEGGFVLLTGEVGTGKTTVCRRLLQLIPDDVEVAFVLNPKVTAPELLGTICDEFEIVYPKNTTSIKTLVSHINEHLIGAHEKGHRAVVIIEEAQNLGTEVLEQIRLLTNLETNQRKLLQMVMLGQPELRDKLAKPELRQLSQRVTARYHLGPLTKEEVPRYVEYRLTAAGLKRANLFPRNVLNRVYRLTGGVPRVINVLCDRALLGTYVQGQDRVDLKTLSKAAREVFGIRPYFPQISRYRIAILSVLLMLAASLFIIYSLPGFRSSINHKEMTEAKIGAVSRSIIPDEKLASAASGPKILNSNETHSALVTGTLERPANENSQSLMINAHEALFTQWHLFYKPQRSKNFGNQARIAGLSYLSGRGGITDLRQLNKPAILSLTDHKGARYYAALLSLKGDAASFKIGKETRILAIKEIASWWDGNYQILWRQPPGYVGAVKEGAKGALVNWLANHLALVSETKQLPLEDQVYDRKMVEKVKQFQLSKGMVPDGVVGLKTIISLSGTAPGQDPILFKDKEGI